MWGKRIGWPAWALLLCSASVPAMAAGLDSPFAAGVDSQWTGGTPNRPILRPPPSRPPNYLRRVQAESPAAPAQGIPDEAIRAEMDKRWGDAERIYRELLAKEPARVDLLQRLAEALAAQNKRLEAAQTIAEAADLRPDDSDLQRRASEAYGAADRRSEAVRYNDRALALRPTDRTLLRRRIDLDLWGGDFAQAAETFKALLAGNPNDTAVRQDLAQFQERVSKLARDTAERGDLDQAMALLQHYRNAGGDEQAYNREVAEIRQAAGASLAIRAEMEKRYGDAERQYRQLLAREPGRADLIERLADVLAVQNKRVDAAQAMAKAAELRPDDADLQLRTSQSFGAAGRMAEAAKYNDRALALRPGDRELLLRRADLQRFAGKFAEAEKILRGLLEEQPGDLNMKRSLALALYGGRRHLDEAARLIADYVAAHPDDKDALLDAARIAAAQRQLKEAAEFLERYRKAGGDEATFRRERAGLATPTKRAAAPAKAGGAPSNIPPAVIAAEGAKRYGEAVRLLRAMLAKEPGRVDLWLRLVDNLAAQKKPLEAAEAMAKAADLRPADADLQLRASEAFGAADRPADALRYVNRALAARPGDLALHRRRAQIATWAGDNAQAEESLRILLAADPGDLAVKLDLGRVLGWRNQLEEAVELLSDYVEQRPGDPEGLLALARVQAGRGNSAAAVALLERYRAAGGDELTYRRELALYLAWATWPYAALAVAEPGLAADPNDFAFHFARGVALQSGYEYGAALAEVDRLTELRPGAPEIAGLRQTIEVALRPYLQFDLNARWETDNISGQATELSYHQPINEAWSVFAGGGGDLVQSVTGNAFAPIQGGTSMGRGAFYAGAQTRLDFGTVGSARVGLTDTGQTTAATWQLALDTRPSDELRLQLGNTRDLQIITPRSLSLGITRIDTALQATYTPDLVWTLATLAREGEFSDSNHFWNGILAPRRAVLRTQDFNVDLGISGNWQSYSSRAVGHGYYAPAFYQNYATTAFVYYKMSPEDGVSLVLSVGANRDETFRNGFKMTTDVAMEATFGALSDWMVKLRAGYTNHGSASGPGFGAENVGMTVVRRF